MVYLCLSGPNIATQSFTGIIRIEATKVQVGLV
uniref:Uncharacterized protein n=1 Tax=Siphoviridae sp. ctDcW16 TaxID=2826199 RepID=A0A8S5MTI6_9CAUD|nr:MAG TPA: hypothetical protein [Siphoviridae sp. ctDcW16]